MADSRRVSCVLCLRRDETQQTGALATKDEVTAHQNCLLFSSGLFCRNSPQFDDLFGFDVDDVLTEVKRGSKLMCNKCKKKGATAGCEVKRCKKSYHYPCAVQDGAHSVEDAAQGEFGLYCFKHYQQKTQSRSHDVSLNGRPDPFTRCRPAKRASEPGSSEVYCPTCKKTEGHISVDSLSRSIIVSYCHKHAPATRRRNANGDSTSARRTLARRPSACSSDSNSSSKRKLSFRDKQEATTSKRSGWNVMLTDNSSNSDGSDSEMDIFAPLDTDFAESANSVPEARVSLLLCLSDVIVRGGRCSII
ncbi:G2/M phase-specific E3 ubiquitin-protein ligase-like isoform X5 [Pseudoliparis swirei]|uniref:G2/M phase-specific E3 ubiquitin-protein ligase-like isoform X5 n=1 Tax=Pseudoliparis swirei TaxID=2059687 RepID=UPI0024BE375F|nr:G2/M phase-specific E3 ubiquitin-protein ligase-like isoform X5 [Pseudoliparis swirei]